MLLTVQFGVDQPDLVTALRPVLTQLAQDPSVSAEERAEVSLSVLLECVCVWVRACVSVRVRACIDDVLLSLCSVCVYWVLLSSSKSLIYWYVGQSYHIV